MFTLMTVYWAANECERQPECTPESVPCLLQALDYAHRRASHPVKYQDISAMAKLITPALHNTLYVYRRVPVFIKGIPLMNHRNIPRAMESLLKNQPDVRFRRGESENRKQLYQIVEDWYREFEMIHPLVNGNGRMGAVLFNWILGTTGYPVSPPNIWEGEMSFVPGGKMGR